MNFQKLKCVYMAMKKLRKSQDVRNMFSAGRIVLQIGVSQIFEKDDRRGTALARCYLTCQNTYM
jgi:hypothetical protein